MLNELKTNSRMWFFMQKVAECPGFGQNRNSSLLANFSF